MQSQPAAMLEHITDGTWHYDLLIGDPTCQPTDSYPLWTGRVFVATWDWAKTGSFIVTGQPHHRRRYLTYEGPISGGRGTVRRIDAGHGLPLRWTDTHRRLDLQMRQFTGTLELVLIGPQWQATVESRTCNAWT